MTVNSEKKIAILAANGFDENNMTAIQRQLTQSGFTYVLIAPEQGLVNGWQGQSWGHYFAVDQIIGSVLGSDYEALVVIGGERSAAKLKQNPHARRIINHFVEAGKPVSAIGSGVSLLGLSEAIANRTLAADLTSVEEVKFARAIVGANAKEQDGQILTSNGADVEDWASATVTLIAAYEVPEEETETESVAA